MAYLFGDNELALWRLELLARVFCESSRRFVEECREDLGRLAEKPPDSEHDPTSSAPYDSRSPRVLDLGCGPGYSTRFLADVLGCPVAGLDNSEAFLYEAKRRRPTRVVFHLHDVTRIPFPVPPARLISCRFLLTHLPEPRLRLLDWATQLCDGGLLLVEEVEEIETEVPTFTRYLEIVEAMLAQDGGELYLGPRLDGFELGNGLEKIRSGIGELRVTNREAAEMFLLNLLAWKDTPFITSHYEPDSIVELEQQLQELRSTPKDDSEIQWRLRQVTLRTTPRAGQATELHAEPT